MISSGTIKTSTNYMTSKKLYDFLLFSLSVLSTWEEFSKYPLRMDTSAHTDLYDYLSRLRNQSNVLKI